MQVSDMETRIREYLESELLAEFGDKVTRETDLFQAGVLESRDYLYVIKFFQSELGITMTDEDLFMNVLVSLAAMTDFAERRQGTR